MAVHFIYMKRVLVTGANGFVGRHLVERLARQNDVIALDKSANMTNFPERTKIVNADISDKGVIRKIVALKPDIIYHLAAISSIPFSVENPRLTIRVNADGTQNLLEAARLYDVKRFIFISTSQVYGIPKYLPIDEAHPINPNNPYSVSKAIGELLTEEYNSLYSLKTTIMRPFSMFGPQQETGFVVPTMITQAISADKIVLQNRSPIRDFLFIEDAIEALVAIIQNKDTIGKTYNLGSGEEISIGNLANNIKELVCPKKEIEYTNVERKVEIPKLTANTGKIKKIGWKPKTTLKEGLIKTIKYYKSILASK